MDPATLIGIGSVAQGIGGLAGAFGKGDTKKHTLDAHRELMRGIDESAKKYRIHRLAMLGSTGGGYGPVQSQGDRIGQGLAQVGDAFQSYGAAKSSARLDKKQAELIDAQIAESRSRTMLNVANSKHHISGPVIGNPSGVGGGLETVLPNQGRDPGTQGDRGVRREATPDQGATQRVSLGNVTGIGPNPEAFEVGISELIAGALIYGPQWLYGGLKQSWPKARQNLERNSDRYNNDPYPGQTFTSGGTTFEFDGKRWLPIRRSY